MTAHTPGPWEAERGAGRGSWIKGSSGEWAALACGDTDARAEANARLIAAAPDLLSAAQGLREAQRAYMADRGNDALGKAVGVAAEQLDSAIAKATGSDQ